MIKSGNYSSNIIGNEEKIEFYCSAREERKVIIDRSIKPEGFQYIHSKIYIPEYIHSIYTLQISLRV